MPVTEHEFFNIDNDKVPRPVISCLRIVLSDYHAFITVFNRGANAGRIVVDIKDWEAVANRLLPKRHRKEYGKLNRY